MQIKSESLKAIAPALVKAQMEMSNALKDSKNPFFKSSYADLNSVREAVLPALNNNNICVLQLTVSENGRNFVRTTLMHTSGEYICSDTEILSSKQNDAQAQGSAISYARRYGLQAFLCVGAVDDDAETTMGRAQPQISKPTSAPVVERETKKPEVKESPVTRPIPKLEPEENFDDRLRRLGIHKDQTPEERKIANDAYEKQLAEKKAEAARPVKTNEPPKLEKPKTFSKKFVTKNTEDDDI